MISFIISFILFVISIPMKTTILGLKTYEKARRIKEAKNEKPKDIIKKPKESTALSKVFKNRKKRNDERHADTKTKLLKKLILALGALVKFIRIMACIFSFVGSLIIFMLLFVIMILLGAVAVSVILVKSDGLTSMTSKPVRVNESVMPEGTASGVNIISDGTMVGNIATMAEFYINDVGTYSQSLFITCSQLGMDVRADCSGFASAVIKLNTGSYPNSCLSSRMFLNNTGVHDNLRKCGFEIIRSEDLGDFDLQAGDLLVADGHVQFYLSGNTSFGWGSKKDSYPSNYSAFKGSDGLFHDKVGHVYQLVIRKRK